MPVVWLDVTTLLGWDRPAVGVLRVESECAAHALDSKDSAVRFCRFDRLATRYHEVAPPTVRAALERIGQPRNGPAAFGPGNTADEAAASPRPGKERLKALFFQLIKGLPLDLQHRIYLSVARRKPSFHAAIRGLREWRLAFRELMRPTLSPPTLHASPSGSAVSAAHPTPFSSGDVYISLGLDWDQKDIVYLHRQKRKEAFKTLLFCYDIIPVKFPHLCVGDVAAKFAKYFADVAWSADLILCISECSRNDLIRLLENLGTPVPATEVVRLGSDIQSPGDRPVSAEVEDVLKREFILYVSTIERRKNHQTLYRAYTRLIDAGRTDLPLLVFVGMPGWGVNDLLSDFALDHRTKPYIRFLNHVSDSDLARLYRGAYFTVFPSLYEGWGLPVAESLAHGKFCLASGAASIPEVGGDLVEYLDPWDVPAWTERLDWYFTHPEAVAAREAAVRAGYAPVSWQETCAVIYDRAQRLSAG